MDLLFMEIMKKRSILFILGFFLFSDIVVHEFTDKITSDEVKCCAIHENSDDFTFSSSFNNLIISKTFSYSSNFKSLIIPPQNYRFSFSRAPPLIKF